MNQHFVSSTINFVSSHVFLFVRNTANMQKKFEIFTLAKMCQFLMKHWPNTLIYCRTFSLSMELINRLKLMLNIPREKAIIIGMLNIYFYSILIPRKIFVIRIALLHMCAKEWYNNIYIIT